MPPWDPSLPLPDQLADAFAALYDWFDDVPGLFELSDGEGWGLTVSDTWPHRDALIQAVAASGWQTPPEMQAELDRAVSQSGGRASVSSGPTATVSPPYLLARTAHMLLGCIDEGVGAYMPKSPPRQLGTHFSLAQQYDLFGHYNTSTDPADGYVFPKWRHGFAGQSLGKQFFNLFRARVSREKVAVIKPRPSGGSRGLIRNPNPTFAVVPFLYTLRDATFRVSVARGGGDYFEVVHDVAGAGLVERARRAVQAVRDLGVTIAIFPELTASPEVADAISEALRGSATRHSALRLAIVGSFRAAGATYRLPSFNTVYVFDGRGKIVSSDNVDHAQIEWKQDKINRYTMSTEEQERYFLQEHLTPARAREEAANLGYGIVVFESGMGRFAVMICEDWARTDRSREYLDKLGCSVVFTIVMDGPCVAQRWPGKMAGFFIDERGAFVVVANSLLLPRRTRPRDLYGPWIPDLPSAAVRIPVGLLFHPHDGGTPPGDPVALEASSVPTSDPASLVSDHGAIPLLGTAPPLAPTWSPLPFLQRGP